MFRKLRGMEQESIFLITIIIIGLISIPIAAKVINPLESMQFEALQKASSIAFYTDSLSTVEKGHAVVGLGENFSVELEIVNDNIFETTYKTLLFFIDFRGEGYYVKVTPYKSGKELKASSVFVLTYPKEDDLKKSFGKPKNICIKKEPDKKLAEVYAC